MDETLKPVLERQMEIYAGFLEHTDFHVGRIIDTLETIGALENTLIYYIIGDNGASAEGTVNGAFNEMANFNGMSAIESPEFMASVKDKLGTVDAYNHYSVGWAWAMCTPYQWTKQVASHWGGTRNGTIVHWPAGITSKGGIRSQFCHVIDVAPTILEAAGLPEPDFVNGVQQSPIEGTSMALHLRGTGRPGAARPAVLRDGRQPRHLLQGLERGHPAQHPLAAERGAAGPGRRRLGALRRQQRLVPGPRPRRGAAGPTGEAATAVADRGGEVQRAADRRPPVRTAERDHRRPPAADHRQHPGAVPRDEAAQRGQRHRHQEPVVLRDRLRSMPRPAGRRTG